MKLLSFEQEWIRRYPERPQILRYMREALGKDVIEYSDMTLTNLGAIRDHMLEKLAQNSVQVYCAIIKAFLNDISDEVELPTMRFSRALRVKKVPSQNCCLTEEELIKFDNYVPRTQIERDVKILFMRGALSGARSSDCKVMNTDNVSNGRLSYVSVKTKTEVSQPLHVRLMKYLEQEPSKQYSRATINNNVRAICRRLGFNEPVTLSRDGCKVTKPKYEWMTMHGSRRTYCTSLAVRGVPAEVIAKLAGHESARTTQQHYICIDVRKLSDEALAFFND